MPQKSLAPKEQQTPVSSGSDASTDTALQPAGNAAAQDQAQDAEGGGGFFGGLLDAAASFFGLGPLVLGLGATGAKVLELQQKLIQAGFELQANGTFDRATEKALQRFQRNNGIAIDGVAGDDTMAALDSASENSANSSTYVLTGTPLLQSGSRGALVRSLQELLNAKGAQLDVDGIFGPLTRAAVIRYQRANGLGVDGLVGPETATHLSGGQGVDMPAPCGDQGEEEIPTGPEDTGPGFGTDAGDVEQMRNAVLSAAESHLGKRYYWGGNGPANFDCSGFVLYVLRSDVGLIDWGDMNAASISGSLPGAGQPKKGDLVFYSGSSGVSHVEMATGSGSQEIGASGGGSSTYGDDPNAKVQYGDMNADGRSRSYGSIEGLINAKLAQDGPATA